jgi:predicted transcriptional regulator of viral defense system
MKRNKANLAPRKRIMDLVRRRGAVRSRDLDGLGLARTYLSRLVRDGVLERHARGLYALAGAEPTENRSLAEACRRVPRGVVCLLSALRFHGLTTQAPFEVWLAVPNKAWRPVPGYPPLRLIYFSAATLATGVETHRVEGADVRVTDPAHTVADCFKYRNKIGLDVALEAIRDCRRQRRATPDELYRAARSRRMAAVIRPYLEALA